MSVPGRLTTRDILLDDPFQAFFEVEPRPVQSAPDCPDRDTKNCRDLLISKPIEFFHHHDRPMVIGQSVQGRLDQLIALARSSGKVGSLKTESSGGSSGSSCPGLWNRTMTRRRRRPLKARLTAIL